MKAFSVGIDVLLSRHRGWLSGKRLGFVSHAAAVDSEGCSSAERLFKDVGSRLTCLFGPEHGFLGAAQAGITCDSARHPYLPVPVFSLYGTTRKPSAEMLKGVDALVFDMQDIGARPYTYVATLRNVLEAAAENGRQIIVADRPIPLPNVVDGPVTEDDFASFVSSVKSPMSYGMTPGETALWLEKTLGLDVDLRVARMAGYHREAGRGRGWPPWIPPSPGIRSWESAACYPATVCFEALSAVDHGRATNLAFQVIGSKWTRGSDLAACLNGLRLPGVRFYAHCYAARPLDPEASMMDGVRMTVVDAARFRPALTAVSLVWALQELYGRKRVWAAGTSRPEFFDKLFGTSSVREALLEGDDAAAIASRWVAGIRSFRSARRQCLLYGQHSS